MNINDVKRIMVVGGGFMGRGIAQVAAAAGYDVVMWDISDEMAQKGMAAIAGILRNNVTKGKMSQAEIDGILAKITPTTELVSAQGCDLVIEAIIEDRLTKKELFQKLEDICPPSVIFATNTSSIPITELSTATRRPEKFIGMHFFSPVPLMKLVEIIKGLKTSEETATLVKDLVLKLGKTGIFVKDGPGFLVNRVNAALRNEVYRCLAEGVATIEDIDLALKLGLGHPIGPLELGDFVGLDVGLAVAEVLWDNFKDPRWAPSLIIKKLVASGDLGRKTGKGWYDYTSGEKKPRADLNF